MPSDGRGKINIVHVTQYLEIGGLESFILELCKTVDKDLFNVTVLCLGGYDESYRESLARCGVAVDLIRKNAKYDWRFFLRASKYLKHRKINIIHAHGGCLLYSAIIGRLSGAKRIIFTGHGMPIASGLKASIEELISLSFTDKIVAVSCQVADYYRKYDPLFKNKIQIIVNGIDQNRYVPCEDGGLISEWKALFKLPFNKRIIGSVGRLERVKNYQLLLKAFSETVHTYNNDAHLVLVGTGSEERDLRSLADRLMIEDRISFLGMQYDLHRIYPLFDVFALSSTTEGTSISLLEAQSCGVPAVVTDVGGNSAIIRDDSNGYLCPSGDYYAIAKRFDHLLNNDEVLSDMKRASRRTIVEKFTIQSMVEEYQRLYMDFSDARHAGLLGDQNDPVLMH